MEQKLSSKMFNNFIFISLYLILFLYESFRAINIFLKQNNNSDTLILKARFLLFLETFFKNKEYHFMAEELEKTHGLKLE